jgi:serine protease Do
MNRRFWIDKRLVSCLAIAVAMGGIGVQGWKSIPSAAASDEPSDYIDPADTLELTGLEGKFETIAKTVSPSVVAISAADGATGDNDDARRSEEMTPAKLQDILDRTTRTVGTGFVIDHDGYILTNEHVIGAAQELWVTTDDRRVLPAFVVGSDPRADLAVLKVPDKDLAPVKLAPDAPLDRGQWTIALGNPYGLAIDGDMCMSVGVVAATARSLPRLASQEDRLYSDLIQTTAQINPGNSGGPLFDISGKVIGVNTAVILPQKQTNGIGFAIPITSRLVAELHDLEQGKEIVYAYVGVTAAEETDRQRQNAGAGDDVGVCVESIEPDSPAAAVLQCGDLILSFDGQTVHDVDQFIRLVGDASVKKPSEVEIFREGTTRTVSVIPSRRPAETAAVTHDNQRLRWRGMLLGPVPANWSESDKSKSGVLVLGIDETSPMKKEGLVVGSIISTLAGRPVSCVADLLKIINDVPPEQCQVGKVVAMNTPEATPAAQTIAQTTSIASRNAK